VATEKEEPEQKPDKRTGREGAKTSFIDWFRSSKKEEKRVPVGYLLFGKKWAGKTGIVKIKKNEHVLTIKGKKHIKANT